MSEIKKIATRDSFGNALVELGNERDDFVVLDADLAAATKTGVFKKAFPERHYDCGIAEQNMLASQQVSPQRASVLFAAASLCLQQAVHTSR